MTASEAPEVEVTEVRLYERDVTFRMPFRFGVVTLTAAPQAFARVRLRTGDGHEGWGMAAEMLAPKWFDKDLALTNEDNFRQLRRALAIATELYCEAGAATPFGLYAGTYSDQIAEAATDGLNPLVACFGPALLDRAVLDALCRIEGLSFFEAVRRNLPGIEATRLTPDLDGFDIDGFLAGLQPAASVHARHTVGMVDPIVSPAEPIGDGLPETLRQVVATYGQRYFKLKVGGEVAADLERLAEIAAVLDRIDGPYYATLDGNEQYGDVDAITELWQVILARPELERLAASVLFIEQPITRAEALTRDVAALSALKHVIIDKSDATLDVFPRARGLGYRGVSSKSCKGLYKSILNRARCRHWNEAAGQGHYFMSGEDLSTQAGLSVQQDLALASLLGLTHIERNGHHYVDGLAGVAEPEQQAFFAAHPDLYHRADGSVRLTIRDGRIALGSLDRPGFAAAAEPDWNAMREMEI
jgi:hypothetical protein